MFQIRHATKSYTTGEFSQTALDDVSLSFRPHEFVAILGASGSGKTTFLNMVGGLDRYDSGDIIIKGKSTSSFKDRDWDAYRNNSVGFIFQSYNLITHLSIVDNVELGMTLSGVNGAVKHQKAIDVLTRVGLKEHLHKKPNQLSGGQMQRVAIARALANDPEIILADEPTGALDTQTSVQIMELIKEIAQDKLVIMVTHNPELAEAYADRVVRFQDGKVIDDTNPLEEDSNNKDYVLKKTSMNFFTALKLSGKNIRTKLGRTSLTAFASSIGIIGIALVLSLSNGFDKQIAEFESNTLSGFPVMITQTTEEFDVEQMREQHSKMISNKKDEAEYPKETEIYPYDASESVMVHHNQFSTEYMEYIEKMDSSYLSGLSYTRTVNMNLLRHQSDEYAQINTSNINFSAYPTMLDSQKEGYLETNYDLLSGEYPSDKTDLVLIVNSYNQLDGAVLSELGLDGESTSINFNDIVGQEYKLVLHNDFYDSYGDIYVANARPEQLSDLYQNSNNLSLRISGIIRPKEEIAMEVLPNGIAYSDELSQFYIDHAMESEIVSAQEEVDYNVLTGEAFAKEEATMTGGMNAMMSNTTAPQQMTKSQMLSMLGGDSTPYMITIYPQDFDAKDDVLNYLNDWNENHETEEQVIYTDLAATMTELSGSVMDAITLVLIAFAAVSLVVSLIMIGIITYISVLERTKEIGVLRALGARKKDITRVFNAETFIVGTCSGALGIGIAYALTFPTNQIIESMTDLPNVAQLNPLHAILLVVVSVLLTMLGGAIPAKFAAKKDPVEALRSE